ncbi:competence protein CoiA [Planococcus donghaensis]|uniref:competence protein CoiA n=1 Tax=Planococcus donghaensis TaxID=414778 RepID=UPI001ED95C70|nr:competence protein CoiA family protein [Planococcus donghaensis]
MHSQISFIILAKISFIGDLFLLPKCFIFHKLEKRRVICILVATTTRQQLFYLTGEYSRKELLEIRLREKFFCPTCHAPLLLKIGEINIPHFAHKTLSDCQHFSEPESSLHLHGKLLLYQFFHQLNFKAELEKYLSEIRQRADLLIDERYAVEFQCSPLPVSQLLQRSKGYQQLSISPIWLKGLKEPCLEGIGLLHLKVHEVAMMQYAGQLPYILLFCPLDNRFYYYSNLFYVSSSRWVGKTKSLSATKQIFPFALPKPLSKEEFKRVIGIFYHVKKQYIHSQLYAGNRVGNLYCRLCYELRLDVTNVPDLFGIPLLGAECFKQPAVLWQLQVVEAHMRGVSIRRLIYSGRLALNDTKKEQQAITLAEDYIALYLKYKNDTIDNSNILDICYDIYCKNVRKLRK